MWARYCVIDLELVCLVFFVCVLVVVGEAESFCNVLCRILIFNRSRTCLTEKMEDDKDISLIQVREFHKHKHRLTLKEHYVVLGKTFYSEERALHVRL